MKIAQIAPIIERTPPEKYGGTERMVDALTEELVRLGHDVTLYATGDSITSAKLSYMTPKPLRKIFARTWYDKTLNILEHASLVYQHQDEFDVIHDHSGPLTLPLASFASVPVIATLHGSFTKKSIPIHKINNSRLNPHLVNISRSQKDPLPNLNYVATIYNGLKMDDYPFNDTPQNYLLFIGRICEEKGVHNAIMIAKKTNLPLLIAAKLDAMHYGYYRKYVKPFLNDRIKWIGEVDMKTRNNLMKNALCLLHPITWREPFGLTLIEAMACGCPVIGFNKGSIPEIIENGKTGFVVQDIDQAVEAIKKINSIERLYCRKYSLSKFNATRMAREYEKVYYRLLSYKFMSGRKKLNGDSKLTIHKPQFTTPQI